MRSRAPVAQRESDRLKSFGQRPVGRGFKSHPGHAEAARKVLTEKGRSIGVPLFKRAERAVVIKTADLMSSPPVTLSSEAKVDDVPGVMWENGVGSVLIVDKKGKLVGIVTERDVLYAASHGLLGKGHPVSAVMSRDLTVATPDEDVTSVIEKMRDYNVRHIPVVDSEGRPVGVVSARDVLDYAVRLISLFMRA